MFFSKSGWCIFLIQTWCPNHIPEKYTCKQVKLQAPIEIFTGKFIALSWRMLLWDTIPPSLKNVSNIRCSWTHSKLSSSTRLRTIKGSLEVTPSHRSSRMQICILDTGLSMENVRYFSTVIWNNLQGVRTKIWKCEKSGGHLGWSRLRVVPIYIYLTFWYSVVIEILQKFGPCELIEKRSAISKQGLLGDHLVIFDWNNGR